MGSGLLLDASFVSHPVWGWNGFAWVHQMKALVPFQYWDVVLYIKRDFHCLLMFRQFRYTWYLHSITFAENFPNSDTGRATNRYLWLLLPAYQSYSKDTAVCYIFMYGPSSSLLFAFWENSINRKKKKSAPKTVSACMNPENSQGHICIHIKYMSLNLSDAKSTLG